MCGKNLFKTNIAIKLLLPVYNFQSLSSELLEQL